MDFQKLIRNKTILAGASIIIGVVLMVFQRRVPETALRLVGYTLLAAAAGYLLSYFFGKAETKDETKLGFAVLAGGGGLLAILLSGTILTLLPVVLGVVLIMSGISNLRAARSAQPVDKIGPVLTIVLGALAVIRPGAIADTAVFLAGAAFVLNGLAELNLIRKFW